MFLHRNLNLNNLLEKKSFFLLGPRATGKTSLIKHQLANRSLIINLLRSDFFLQLNNEPWSIESIIDARTSAQDIIVIDEIHLTFHRRRNKPLFVGSCSYGKSFLF